MLVSTLHTSINGLNVMVVHTENHTFTIRPYFADATRVGLWLLKDQSTGNQKEFQEEMKDYIEFDSSYKSGVFCPFDNAIPLLKKACWEDLNFDNWFHKYEELAF